MNEGLRFCGISPSFSLQVEEKCRQVGKVGSLWEVVKIKLSHLKWMSGAIYWSLKRAALCGLSAGPPLSRYRDTGPRDTELHLYQSLWDTDNITIIKRNRPPAFVCQCFKVKWHIWVRFFYVLFTCPKNKCLTLDLHAVCMAINYHIKCL